MNSVFIGGTPNAGKSTLAKKLAEKFDMKHVDLDLIREQIWQNEKLRYWCDFFEEKDEEQYWKETTSEQHWENIRKQSEAFWPVFLEKITTEMAEGPLIFEAVNVLPHLAKEQNFKGIYLIAASEEQLYERNKIRPRWGETDELWKI
jgi:shikimate kinase